MGRLLPLILLLATAPWLSGFVLLSSTKATLPVTAESPQLTFLWDGKAPSIKAKDEFAGGAYAALDDTAFMQQLLVEAMGIWNAVPGAYVTLVATAGTATLDEKDKQFSIVTEKSDNLTSAAYATPRTGEDAPEIIEDCDISIADQAAEAENLAYTIAHELGHCLGLGHAHTNYNAIMGYSRASYKLKLGADDKAGLIFLYPDPAAVDGEPKELVCGVIARGAGTDAAALALLLLPLALLVIGSRNAAKPPDGAPVRARVRAIALPATPRMRMRSSSPIALTMVRAPRRSLAASGPNPLTSPSGSNRRQFL